MTMARGASGSLCTPLLTVQVKPRLGIYPSRLCPIDSIARIGAPPLLIARGPPPPRLADGPLPARTCASGVDFDHI